ncbi:amino acid/amide ABC transporter substrate-binding protein, HAAT family [Noviherbaspirillum suwonense]|jgi:branched-chain amino acid transport system substrate-binding protein|uniref:Amino acid/amide ABC transporter substrate-binding protein, HAAT family n=2 Tax=Noviherbaspirillum suwonense TaxID=1224511 RepID=A0ABY1QML1_9BURK|nr:amino acid/amide ABC transporter substrate-binding protein, HAAT family [Noviherbaspirillum suwonense]
MQSKFFRWFAGMSCISVAAVAPSAFAQIKVGVTISTTGPAAAIGAPTRNAMLLWPKEVAGQKVEYIILDDASDTTNAVRNLRKLTAEEKVDIIVGPNTTPNALAMLDPLAESQTPMVALAASSSIVEPQDARRAWAFKMPQNDTHMTTILTQHMADNGIRTVAFIGFADAYGEGWWREFSKLAELRKLKIVANERFARTDTSVTGQVLKIMAAKPDAVLVAGSATPAVLPQKTLVERGYQGRIYQTHGIGTLEFLKVGGKDVEGTFFPTGPAVVAKQLPANNPVRKVALDFTQRYEAAYGEGTVTQFAADAWGAWMLIANAVPQALKTAKPGTVEFRTALRAALENTRELTVPQGVINMNARDHVGLDQRSRVMGRIQGNRFTYAYGG